jgi:hypothetical protein
MEGWFAQVQCAGFDIGMSIGKLTKAMLSRDVVVHCLGLLGQMSKTRDINAAWNSAKRQIVRDHPDRFCLGCERGDDAGRASRSSDFDLASSTQVTAMRGAPTRTILRA